jgi:hypothetical protein
MAILRHGPLMQSANIYIHHIFSHYNHLYKSTAITMIDKHAQITLQMPLLKLANVSVKSQKAQPFLQKRAGQGGGLQPAAFVAHTELISAAS